MMASPKLSLIVFGYYGSNGATDFGLMVPVFTVQMMPCWS